MSRPGIDASASCSPPDISITGITVPTDERRLLAARLLESTLLRLGRAGVVLERRLVPGLSRMHRLRLYTHLGYVRLADFLTERLGMSLRRCQAILRLERALAPLPRLARALEAGELSVSRLELAAAAATPETEADWLDRAKRLPLPILRDAARAASTAASIAASATAATSATPATAAAGSPTAAASNDSPLIEQDDPGRVISFVAPAPVVAIWHWTLDLVRRVAGQQEPAWRCAEYLAAEFLSGAPETVGDPPQAPDARPPIPGPDPAGHDASTPMADPHLADPDAAASGTGRRTGPAPPASDERGTSAWLEAASVVREALASIGASADLEAILSIGASADPKAIHADGPRWTSGAESHPDDELDAWDLDAHLRRLVRLRQSLAWRQGRLLAAVARLNLHHDLGFETFDAWVEDRLAMSPRRARYLVSLDRRLRDLPLLADAYRRGLVSWCQARLLIRVVRPPTQSRWIRYARQVTVRRLEDVIIECEVCAAESPTASAAPFPPAHISASPLPPAEARPEACPTDAPPDARPDALADALPDPTPRHTSAPPLDLASVRGPSFNLMTRRRVSFWCPLDVASLWDSALRSCRAAAGRNLEDWECFLLLVQAMRETWENQEDPHWRRRYHIFERDGWRCKAPGCTSRSGLNEHHITFRSQQGADYAANLVTLCVGHHQDGLHAARIRCFGSAPDALWWDLGARPGREPLARYFGDRLVARRPFVPAGLHKRAPSPRAPSTDTRPPLPSAERAPSQLTLAESARSQRAPSAIAAGG